MKSLVQHINEAKDQVIIEKSDATDKTLFSDIKESNINEDVTDADSFRDYAYAKLKAVFGDEYDSEIADKSIEDLIKDKSDDEDWGAVIGKLTANMGGE